MVPTADSDPEVLTPERRAALVNEAEGAARTRDMAGRRMLLWESAGLGILLLGLVIGLALENRIGMDAGLAIFAVGGVVGFGLVGIGLRSSVRWIRWDWRFRGYESRLDPRVAKPSRRRLFFYYAIGAAVFVVMLVVVLHARA
jgi:hypothetical protein